MDRQITAASAPQRSIGRLLGPLKRPVGLAFLTGERHMVTCAHAVNAALGRPARDRSRPPADAEVVVQFVAGAGDEEVRRFASVAMWDPDRGPFDDHDVAGLLLHERPGGGRVPLTLAAPDEAAGAPARIWRPASGAGNGYLFGRLVDVDGLRSQFVPDGSGQPELPSELSGGPVWRSGTSEVIGLLQSELVLNPDVLVDAWPDLLYRPPSCPYPGLLPFREENAGVFFGRDAFVSDLVAATKRLPVVAVMGPSGSGKSSVIEAGLVPALRRDRPTAVIRFSPGGRGVSQFAAALAQDGGEALSVGRIDEWEQRLRAPGGVLASLDKARLAHGSDRLIVVIDQFEQVLAAGHDPAQRTQLLSMLADLVTAGGGTLLVALSIRDDFFGPLIIADRGLGSYLQAYALPLRPMSATDLRAAIERPAAAAGGRRPVTFQDGLVDQIIEDLQGSPGELSLLQFTLRQLWQRHSAGVLALKAYREIGGVSRALAQHAEERFAVMSDRDQASTRRILTRLVTPGTRDVGRRLYRGQLRADDWDMVQRLADDRLVVVGRDPVTDLETVEPAHEALLRGWRSLQSWLAETEQFRAWESATDVARAQWEDHQRDPLLVLRGPLLERAQQMLALYAEDSAHLDTYIEQSRLVAEADTRARREQADRNEAIRLATQAELARSAPGTGPSTSLALGVLSLRRCPTFEGGMAVRRALATVARPVACRTHSGPVYSVAFSRDGRLFASASGDHSARILDPATGVELTRVVHGGPVVAVVFSPDGRLLATASGDRTARVVRTATGEELFTIIHDDCVRAVAFSPDSKLLATASDDHALRVLAVADASERYLVVHDDWVRVVAFSPDGSLLATASDDHTVRIFAADTGVERARFTHDGPVVAVAFSPDGGRLATASDDRTARVISTATGAEVLRTGNEDWVRAVAFSPDGTRLAVGGGQVARILDAATGAELARIGHEATVYAVAFSPDGSRLASAGSDRTVRIADGHTGAEQLCIVHDGPVYAVAFGADGNRLGTGCGDGMARIVDPSTGAERLTCRHLAEVVAVAFGPDGATFATAAGALAKVWRAEAGTELVTVTHDGPVVAFAYSPDGRLLATASDDHTALVTDLRDGMAVARVVHHAPVAAVCFSPDGRLLATASDDQTASVTDLMQGLELLRVEHTAPVVALVFTLDGRLLATASDDGTVRVTDVEDGVPIVDVGHDGAAVAVAFSPDGRLLGTASDDATARVWSVPTGNEVLRVHHGASVDAVAFSTDGRWLVTASEDHTARVTDVALGLEMTRVAHDGPVVAVVLSPDGRLLATASDDHTARVVEVPSGTEVARIAHDGPVAAIGFSPDGEFIVTGSDDRTGRVWDASHHMIEVHGTARATRNLSQVEWERYLPGQPFEKIRTDLP